MKQGAQCGAPARGATVCFVEILRGIAPVLVIWVHLSSWYAHEMKIAWPGNDHWRNWVVAPLRLYQDGGHLGVILFFLISGYIITVVSLRETPLEFALKRLFRLGPILFVSLMLASLAMSAATRLGVGTIGIAPHGITDIVWNLTTLNWPLNTAAMLSVTWTLFIEVVFYAGTGILIRPTCLSPRAATWAMLVGALLVYVIGTRGVLGMSNAFMPYLPLLLFGRAVGLFDAGRLGGCDSVILCAAALGLFVLMYQGVWPGRLAAGPFEPVFTYLLALVLFAGLWSARPQSTPRLFRFLARISYSLYLLHVPIGSLVLGLALASGASFGLSLGLALAAVVAASAVSFRFIEAPMQRLGRRLAAQLSALSSAAPAV